MCNIFGACVCTDADVKLWHILYTVLYECVLKTRKIILWHRGCQMPKWRWIFRKQCRNVYFCGLLCKSELFKGLNHQRIKPRGKKFQGSRACCCLNLPKAVCKFQIQWHWQIFTCTTHIRRYTSTTYTTVLVLMLASAKIYIMYVYCVIMGEQEPPQLFAIKFIWETMVQNTRTIK